MEEGYIAGLFVKGDLGLALAPQMCPDQSQAFKEVNNRHYLSYRKKKKKNLDERRAGAPRNVPGFAQISKNNCLRRTNIELI